MFVSPKEIPPLFPGCAQIEGNNQEKNKCSQEKLIQYFYNGLNEIEKPPMDSPRIVIQFTISKIGTINNVQLVRGEESTFTKAAIKRIEEMNNLDPWTPGMQAGKAVDIRYTLPVQIEWEE